MRLGAGHAGNSSVDAFPLAVTATQINAVLPSNAPLGEATITVMYNGRTSNAQRVRIVLDIGAGRAQVNDRPADRCLLGECLDGRHQVVLNVGLDSLDTVQVDRFGRSFQIGALRGGDEAGGFLSAGQLDPDAPP